jgi:hypothetical protein
MKCDTIMRNALSPELKLEITMRYLATGDSYKSLQYLYRVSASSICSFLPAVFDAIYEGLIEYIQVTILTKNNHALYNIMYYYLLICMGYILFI